MAYHSRISIRQRETIHVHRNTFEVSSFRFTLGDTTTKQGAATVSQNFLRLSRCVEAQHTTIQLLMRDVTASWAMGYSFSQRNAVHPSGGIEFLDAKFCGVGCYFAHSDLIARVNATPSSKSSAIRLPRRTTQERIRLGNEGRTKQ